MSGGTSLTRAGPAAPAAVAALSPVALAAVLDQSVDCVKLIGLDGAVQYMNPNGLCAMEVDDTGDVVGRPWAGFWPAETQAGIRATLPRAAAGEAVRLREFCPTAKGSPRWWDVTVSAVVDADQRHAGYLVVSRDVTENQLSREAMEIATAELKHRLRNTYTMIGSLLYGYARGNAEHEEFARIMGDRLGALSTAQALFVSDEAPCELDLLVPALVLPFESPICPATIDVPPGILVNRGQADALALVIGELAVNSAKHGALAHGGTLRIASAMDGRVLTISWTENCVKPVAARSRDGGQGLKLIDRIVRARRGTIAMDWHSHGLTVRTTFGLD